MSDSDIEFPDYVSDNTEINDYSYYGNNYNNYNDIALGLFRKYQLYNLESIGEFKGKYYYEIDNIEYKILYKVKYGIYEIPNHEEISGDMFIAKIIYKYITPKKEQYKRLETAFISINKGNLLPVLVSINKFDRVAKNINDFDNFYKKLTEFKESHESHAVNYIAKKSESKAIEIFEDFYINRR